MASASARGPAGELRRDSAEAASGREGEPDVPVALDAPVAPANTYNATMQELIQRLLIELGEDPAREGLVRTPIRVDKALRFLTSGYAANVDDVLNGALFNVDYSEMVIVRDIDFYSLCEHHLLPFFGKCHVAYIPNGKVIGLSKIPRLVDIFARRLQLQERMTNQIAETIVDKIKPLGVAVVCEGTHLCMAMRGVEKQNSYTITSAMLGAFRDQQRTRMEFLELLKLRSGSLSTVTGLPLPGTSHHQD
jgi:GTP cyclohydrolase IA